MITKEINENRKLISAFMGYEFADIGYFDDEDETEWQRKNQDWMKKNDLEDVGEYFVNIKENKWHEFDDAIYHLSYDWLMPVVENIEETTPYKVNILECECEIYSMVSDGFITHKNSVIDKSRDTKIEAVYEAIVEFINWYNENKK